MVNTKEKENETSKSSQNTKTSSDNLSTVFMIIFFSGQQTLKEFKGIVLLTLASAAFLTCVAAGAGAFAFASTLASSRKTDPNMFSKGQTPPLPSAESGVQLAIRALKWGTFYAFGGCGLFFYGVWKMSGANDASIFNYNVITLLLLNKKKKNIL